ncbi:uncharacterized protein VICG_01231 [Vittaforma corneae ATCC 50505]|uniref:Uncharacterized protein n=1 Tax=Vittaforma corneae (strain ATCC 50505) TaxID=993615 RepID=L2GN45_VITCO|nr:uncharacterized protein VICG_01231 [Vittaforma corneae ATCC 50505]ELA41727.1 hypothetical protein VICG_01231 [Vittaforma corneae ATCC 50505]
MSNPLNCCCPNQKYTIYITGSMEDKRIFCEKVFNIKLRDISFSENLVHFNGTSLILLVIANEGDLRDVHQMHMKMANAVILLRDRDENVETDKKTLFVRMNGKSQLESENNLIVRSVIKGSYEDARDGVKELTKLIKH